MSTNVRKSNRTSAKKIVLVGVFGAISTVLMLLSFNVPFIPTSEKSSFTNVGINGTLNDNSINTVLIAPKTPTRTIFLADVLFDFFTFVLMVRPPS